MNEIKLIPVYECSDATVWYNVIFKEGITVEKFVQYVVYNSQREWGDITIRPGFGNVITLEYKRGRLIDIKNPKQREAYELIKYSKVVSVTANGGWGLMSYFINAGDNAVKEEWE